MLQQVSPALQAAAADTFRRLGPKRFSLTAVAESAGVSRGTVRKALGNRDAAIKVALDVMGEGYFHALTGIAEQHTTLAAGIAEGCVEFCAHRQRSDQQHAPATASSLLVQLLGTYGEDLMLRAVEFWTPRVQAAQKTGEVRADVDPQRAAEWIVRLMLSFELLPPIDVNLGDPDAVRWFVAEFIVKGLG